MKNADNFRCYASVFGKEGNRKGTLRMLFFLVDCMTCMFLENMMDGEDVYRLLSSSLKSNVARHGRAKTNP